MSTRCVTGQQMGDELLRLQQLSHELGAALGENALTPGLQPVVEAAEDVRSALRAHGEALEVCRVDVSAPWYDAIESDLLTVESELAAFDSASGSLGRDWDLGSDIVDLLQQAELAGLGPDGG